MTLSFKTKINGVPTLFVQKIWVGINFNQEILGDITTYDENIEKARKLLWECIGKGLATPHRRNDNPKIHSIRADTKNRWKVGTPIHFVINNRTPQRFQFAPVLPVKSIQTIQILHFEKSEVTPRGFMVLIDDEILTVEQIELLARNDGFESTNDFFKYFNGDFIGKIIHWTNFKYENSSK